MTCVPTLICDQDHAYRDAYVPDYTDPIIRLYLPLKVTIRPSNLQAYIGLQQLLTALKTMEVRTTASNILDLASHMYRRLGLVRLEHGTCFMA